MTVGSHLMLLSMVLLITRDTITIGEKKTKLLAMHGRIHNIGIIQLYLYS